MAKGKDFDRIQEIIEMLRELGIPNTTILNLYLWLEREKYLELNHLSSKKCTNGDLENIRFNAEYAMESRNR